MLLGVWHFYFMKHYLVYETSESFKPFLILIRNLALIPGEFFLLKKDDM